MYTDYMEMYKNARIVEEKDTSAGEKIKVWPRTLCEYIEKKMSIFTLKTYILDPEKIENVNELPQATDYDM